MRMEVVLVIQDWCDAGTQFSLYNVTEDPVNTLHQALKNYWIHENAFQINEKEIVEPQN